MLLTDAIARLLAYFPHEERSIPDSGTYPGRNASAIGAINGALQEYHGTGQSWKRRAPRGALLHAPSTVTVQVTNGSRMLVFDAGWQDWFSGCTIAISGASTDNQIEFLAEESSYASATINPAGSNNSITFTATAAGRSGNDITITFAAVATSHLTIVDVSGNAITITPGSKSRMIVTGTLTDDATGTFIPSGTKEGKPQWSNDGLPYSGVSGVNGHIVLYYESGRWHLKRQSGTFSNSYYARIISDADFPDGLTGWDVQTGSGQPSIAAATSTAQQVIAAVTASAAAAAKVSAAAFGDVTGIVAPVSITFLAGGSGPSELLYPFDGASGTYSATILHDCITLDADVQTVLTPVRIVDGPPLLPVDSPEQLTLSCPRERDYGHHNRIPAYPSTIRKSQSTGTPRLYFVDSYQEDEYANPEWRMLISPAPAAGMLLSYRARTSPPTFTAADGSKNIPVPHNAIESIILPIAALRLSGQPFFNQGPHVEEIKRQAKLARTELFSMSPQGKPGKRMRPGL